MKSKLFNEARTNPKAGTEGLHFVAVLNDAGETTLHVFDSEDQAGLYHGQLRGYGGIKRIGRLKGGRNLTLGYINDGVAKQFGAEPRMIRHDQGETNPARRPKESPLYVKYLSLKSDEEPFMMQGTKYEYVWAEYPGGIKDIGVYSYANDLVYSYDSFRQMMNLDRTNPVKSRKENYSDFSDWETDAFRAGATQVVRIGEDLFSAIKMKDGSLVKLDEEGFVDMRSRAGQKVRKESITVGSWYGNNGEIYRQMIRNNPVIPRKGESSREFTARCMSEEKASFPKTKQRIAVCLSKSRKRNPLESGATISDDEDVNRQAAKMG